MLRFGKRHGVAGPFESSSKQAKTISAKSKPASTAFTGFCITFLLLPVCGCGTPEPPRVEVAGQVLLGQQPMEQGSIRLIPEVGRPVTGEIGADGRFELTSPTVGQTVDQGVLLGKYAVEVTASRIVDDETAISLVPAKYANHHTSGIEVVIDEPTDSLSIRLSLEDPLDTDNNTMIDPDESPTNHNLKKEQEGADVEGA